jgi:dTDP-4-dehydrorhamnose 3,5-epimerase
MQVNQTVLPGVLIIEPAVYRDERGFFVEAFHAERYGRHGMPNVFPQDNHSRSVYGTLRGLHLQRRRPQGKLVRVVEGEIWDVAVDIRPESGTFGRWVGVALSAENFKQLYVPPGLAHGFCVMSPYAQVEYKCTEVYDASDEAGITYDDPALAIEWPITVPILSARDRRHPKLSEFIAQLSPSTKGRYVGVGEESA